MNQDQGWFGRAFLLAVVAWLAGSTLGGRKPEAAALPNPAAVHSERKADEDKKSEPVRPRGADRALALVWDALSPDPLFVPDGKGGMILEPDWESRGDGRVPRKYIRPLKKLAARSDAGVQFLIATLPDWSGSALKWQFDPGLAAIQSAASSVGYVPDSFFLPSRSETADRSRNQAAQGDDDAEIGAVLFRRFPIDDSSTRADFLLVMLVGETATRGVEKQAFVDAATVVAEWQRNGPDRAPIRVLGPVYSGSLFSMRVAMKSVRATAQGRPGAPHFDLISGSATSTKLERNIEFDSLATFRRTVATDDELQAGMAEYLGGIDRHWRCGMGMALLVESNTGWGAAVRGENLVTKLDKTPCTRCATERNHVGPPYFPCAVQVPYPMHVSRLRSELSKEPKARVAAPVPDPSGTALNLNERDTPVDRIPSMTPDLTSASVDTMLSAVFRTLQDLKVRAVGIYATDKRDHVFLAQEMARRAPDLLAFTLESDVIYLHPDARAFLRGTLVASAYPLYDKTQLLTVGRPAVYRRVQFQSQMAQGLYNATLMHLGGGDRMLDCRSVSPADPSKGPTPKPWVWISEVGRDATFPVAAYDPITRKPAELSSPDLPYLRVDGRTRTLMLAVALSLIGFLATPFLMAWHRRKEEGFLLGKLAPSGGTNDRVWKREVAMEARASLFACFGATAAIAILAVYYFTVYLAQRSAWVGARAETVVSCASLVLYAGSVAAAAWSFWGVRRRDLVRAIAGWVIVLAFGWSLFRWCRLTGLTAEVPLYVAQPRFDHALRWTLLFAVLSVFVDLGTKLPAAARMRRVPVLLGLAALAGLAVYAGGGPGGIPLSPFYVDRMSAIGSLVSPAVAVLFLAGAVFGWGVWNLRRLWFIPRPIAGPESFLQERTCAAGVVSDEDLLRPALSTGLWGVFPFLAAIAGYFEYNRHSTADGAAFSLFIWAGSSCVLTTMTHTLAHTVHVGRSLLFALRAVDRHPLGKRFGELHEENFAWRPSLRELRPFDLEPLMRTTSRFVHSAKDLLVPRQLALASGDARLNVVAHRGQRKTDALAPPAAPAQPYYAAPADASRIAMRPEDVQEVFAPSWDSLPATGAWGKHHAMRAFRSTEEWIRLDKLARYLNRWLRTTYWSTSPPAATYDVKKCAKSAEYLVAFHLAVGVRDMLTRLISGFVMAVVGLALLMSAHLFYSFQGRPMWLALDWTAVGISSIVAITILIGLEKNSVLSRLWKTEEGKIGWASGLSWRMAVFAVVTVLSIFAALFPEVGGNVAGWLEPVRKTIP